MASSREYLDFILEQLSGLEISLMASLNLCSKKDTRNYLLF